MTYTFSGHNCVDELSVMCQVFFPGVKPVRAEAGEKGGLMLRSEAAAGLCRTFLFKDGASVCHDERACKPDDRRELRGAVKRGIYAVFSQYTGFTPPWGSFTGIRPSKLVHDRRKKGLSDAETAADMAETFCINHEKIALSFAVADAEAHILAGNNGTAFSLYIGVPFCPSRCLYCSFTSYDLKKYGNLVDAYLDCVIREMAAMAPFGAKRRLESVYVGGGTPTALSAKQLDRLLAAVSANFDTEHAAEWTVEAGRPDTINREKLDVMQKHGVTRISVNPQTLNDDTLVRIGRAHTCEQFFNAFKEARSTGFDNINVDLIVGLPGESAADAARTMALLAPLRPESITVHTLAVKRASKLREQMDEAGEKPPAPPDIDAMMGEAGAAARRAGLLPYYMYRQKNMVGHFENIGYAKPGHECMYNVQMIGDAQTVLALGAGATTKLYTPAKNRIERFFNVKSLEEYIGRVDEMIARKAGVLS